MKYKLPNYTILTSKSSTDIFREEYDNEYYGKEQEELEKLNEEQYKILKKYGYENDDCEMYLMHFFNSAFSDEFTTEMTIYDAIQCLAIKDSCDLVKYENGNIGYMACYNCEENGFEILGKGNEMEEDV